MAVNKQSAFKVGILAKQDYFVVDASMSCFENNEAVKLKA